MKTPLKLPIVGLAGIALGVLAALTLLLTMTPFPAQAEYHTTEKSPSAPSASISPSSSVVDSAVHSRPASKPARPSNVTATTSETAITLTWDDPGDSSITGYEIRRRIVTKGEKLAVIEEHTGTASTSYVDTDVTPNTKYAYRIKAISAAGTSGSSKNLEVRYLIDEVIPQNLQADARHYRVNVKWDAPSYSGATGYKLFRKLHSDKNGEFEVVAPRYSRTHTDYHDFDVEPNKRYVYRVVALFSSGESNPSSLLDIRTPRLLGMDEEFTPPVHMATTKWFGADEFWPGRVNSAGVDAVEVDFTIHNDIAIDESKNMGMYFMILNEAIAGIGFYVGLQIDNNEEPLNVGHGRRLIFSRWDTRDLANVRLPEENSWSQSAGYEGDFVGARIAYNWGAGEYRLRLAADDSGGTDDTEGKWFGVWITDMSTGETTWGGSLRFPYQDGEAKIEVDKMGSVVEVYGIGAVTPRDIPTWHVSMERPKYTLGTSHHRPVQGLGYFSHHRNGTYLAVPNSNVDYDASEDVMHFYVGGGTEREEGDRYFLFPE